MIEVSCALLFKENHVLIAQNGAGSDHAFQWEFPGGKINPKESARTSIVREIEEELDLEIRIIEELIAVDWDYGFKKIRLIPFVCFIEKGELQVREHLAVSWVSFQELLAADLSAADKGLLEIPENRQTLKKYFGE